FEAARRIGSLADFLVIPSNGAHLFQREIEQASGREVLSIIDVTLAEVKRRGWRRIGVLGLGDPVVYTRRLAEIGLKFEVIDEPLRAPLNTAIFRLMEGRNDAGSTRAAQDAVTTLRSRQVDGIILGCTELPLLLNPV